MGLTYDSTVPEWISGRKLYEISGPDNSALGCHFSGFLRSLWYALDDNDIEVLDEYGNKWSLSTVLYEAAERLDDAHEEWLEERV